MQKILVQSLLGSMVETFWSNKRSNTDTFKTLSKKLIQKKGEATSNFTVNEKIDKIAKALSCKPKFDVEIRKDSELGEKTMEIPKERYITREGRK